MKITIKKRLYLVVRVNGKNNTCHLYSSFTLVDDIARASERTDSRRRRIAMLRIKSTSNAEMDENILFEQLFYLHDQNEKLQMYRRRYDISRLRIVDQLIKHLFVAERVLLYAASAKPLFLANVCCINIIKLGKVVCARARPNAKRKIIFYSEDRGI